MPSFKCSLCLDKFDYNKLNILECEHKACHDCLRTLFANYPAHCCGTIDITSERAQILGADIVEAYIQKRLEKESGANFYCSRPHCSAFIPPERIFDTMAVCPSCHEYTCTKCRQDDHGYQPCVPNRETEITRELAQQEGWRACKGCGHIIERTLGCNRMRCACNAEFCYQCGSTWKTCGCTYLVQTPDPDTQVQEDQEAQGFMAEMQETVQIVLDTGDITEITRFLEEMKITQGEDGHPDWWQPFIDDIEDAMAEWHTDL